MNYYLSCWELSDSTKKILVAAISHLQPPNATIIKNELISWHLTTSITLLGRQDITLHFKNQINVC